MIARAQRGGGERASEVAAPVAVQSFVLGGVCIPAVATRKHLSGVGLCPARSSCKPEQPAHFVRWLVATAAWARTDRWPFPDVKPSLFRVPDVRGSRASTDSCVRPNLFKLPEVPTMEKPAPALPCPGLKSLPLRFASTKPEQILGILRKPLIMRRYTLCAYHRVLIKPQRGVRAVK